MPLTRRQKEILDFLTQYLTEHGYAPTLEEIADNFDISSLNAIYKHLKALEERGFIRRLSHQARSIQLLNPESSAQPTLPLLGAVAAGRPIDAVRDVEEVAVPESFLGRNRSYVLKVNGDSMIDEHIQDGDLVIVEEQQSAQNGDMVVALIDGESVTLKKFFREGDQIRLQPANPQLDPIFVREDQLQIQGVVKGVMRKY